MLFRRSCPHSLLLTFVFVLGGTVFEPLSAQVKARPPNIDFGERGHHENPQATIELVNEFPHPVHITRLKPSCSCIKVSPSAVPGALAAGGSTAVRITMGSGRAFGRLAKYVEVTVSGPAGPIGKLRVPVSMRVFENYHLEPRELRFEGEFGGSPATQSVLVESRRKRPGKRLDLKFVRIRDRSRRVPGIGKFFEVRVSDHPRGAKITVSLSPHHPEGRVWGELEALLEGKPLVVPIAGDMFRGIVLSPKYFNFNRVEAANVATHVEETVLRAIDGRAFEIVGMRSRITRPENARFSVELKAESRHGGAEHRIRARLVAPDGLPLRGSFSGKVAVKTTHPEKPELELGFFGFFAKPKK